MGYSGSRTLGGLALFILPLAIAWLVEMQRRRSDPYTALRVKLAARDIKTNVCLNMIAKDEVSNRLVTSLKAAAEHVSGYMLCDTGSKDGTPDVARKFFDAVNISGAVETHEWKDFSHNRNLCLEAGRRLLGDKCQYWLLLDADQVMESDDGTTLAELKLEGVCYWLREQCHGTDFSNKRIVNASLDWKYVGKVHEYIALAEDAESNCGSLPPAIYSQHHSNWNRGFDRDAKLLEESVKEDPTDPRTRFYLGNTYRSMGLREKAIQQWGERVGLGGWKEEMYLSLCDIGNHLEQIVHSGRPQVNATTAAALVKAKVWDAATEGEEAPPGPRNVTMEDAVHAYEVALELIGTRKEAPYNLARLARTHYRDYAACQLYADMAVNLPNYNDRTLFADSSVYKYKALDELCTCAYYVDEAKEAGHAACKELLARLHAVGEDALDYIENEILERTDENIKWYDGTAPGLQPSPPGEEEEEEEEEDFTYEEVGEDEEGVEGDGSAPLAVDGEEGGEGDEGDDDEDSFAIPAAFFDSFMGGKIGEMGRAVPPQGGGEEDEGEDGVGYGEDDISVEGIEGGDDGDDEEAGDLSFEGGDVNYDDDNEFEDLPEE